MERGVSDIVDKEFGYISGEFEEGIEFLERGK